MSQEIPAQPYGFHLNDVQYLRREIEHRSSQQSAIERDLVIALVAIYTGLATAQAAILDPDLRPLARLAWWLPFFLSLYARSRFFSHDSSIHRIARYLRRCEVELALTGFGWETDR